MKINQLPISITLLTIALLLLEQSRIKANSFSQNMPTDPVYLLSSTEEVSIDSSEQINSTSGTEYSQSYQQQETGISLNVEDLTQPLWLKITASPGVDKLAGEIKLGDRVIKTITKTSTEIDLAPLLVVGSNQIEITGEYDPSQESIQVELTGKNTSVNQQTSGNSKLNQALAIQVSSN